MVVGMCSRQVDVWVADLRGVETDERILSVAELGRALFINSPELLCDYLAVHSWLRRRLAEYLEVSADSVVFEAGEWGKPVVVDPQTDLTFNVAYSDSMAVLAVGFRRQVGVDLESIETAEVSEHAARTSLAPGEKHSYDHAVDPVRTFLRFWVRKEALAKAGGIGIGRDMESTDVSGISPVAVQGYEISDVNLGDGFVAAVAAPEGSDIRVYVDDTTTAPVWGQSRQMQAVVAG